MQLADCIQAVSQKTLFVPVCLFVDNAQVQLWYSFSCILYLTVQIGIVILPDIMLGMGLDELGAMLLDLHLASMHQPHPSEDCNFAPLYVMSVDLCQCVWMDSVFEWTVWLKPQRRLHSQVLTPAVCLGPTSYRAPHFMASGTSMRETNSEGEWWNVSTDSALPFMDRFKYQTSSSYSGFLQESVVCSCGVGIVVLPWTSWHEMRCVFPVQDKCQCQSCLSSRTAFPCSYNLQPKLIQVSLIFPQRPTKFTPLNKLNCVSCAFPVPRLTSVVKWNMYRPLHEFFSDIATNGLCQWSFFASYVLTQKYFFWKVLYRSFLCFLLQRHCWTKLMISTSAQVHFWWMLHIKKRTWYTSKELFSGNQVTTAFKQCSEEKSLFRCYWKRKPCNISQAFTAQLTNRGICYKFNFKTPALTVTQSGKHWKIQSQNEDKQKQPIILLVSFFRCWQCTQLVAEHWKRGIYLGISNQCWSAGNLSCSAACFKNKFYGVARNQQGNNLVSFYADLPGWKLRFR